MYGRVISTLLWGENVNDGLIDVAYILVGFIFLMTGGEGLVQGAVRISGKLQIPPLLVGFTVVAIGTSLPELAVALQAVSSGSEEIAVGGVLGSNVANVMLVLGSAALLGACSEPDKGTGRDSIAVMVCTTFLLFFVLLGEIPLLGGVVMVIGLVGYYWYAYRDARKSGEQIELADSWLPDKLTLAVPTCILGGLMIWQGAVLLVEGATGVATKYDIPEDVIGLTLVALGTSLPELAVTLVAGLRGQGGVAIGNVLGSNVMNILGILGTAAIYAPGGGLEIAGEFASRDIWVVMATSGFIAWMLLSGRDIDKRSGFAMICTYLVYMGYLGYVGIV
ncbi:MAG TPA: calcium/sodium antiporter [Candidatus Thalassarchaeaceae archaeon]|jgi:cation:H+ antiporter|nr:calcium/sodium antiporter [Candidatus Thalassarchaeaceae archaeon]|tara:strand:+ start:34306 stop:35310 length:1005 start_codon:yes stop_codon:yes gene_type:complete